MAWQYKQFRKRLVALENRVRPSTTETPLSVQVYCQALDALSPEELQLYARARNATREDRFLTPAEFAVVERYRILLQISSAKAGFRRYTAVVRHDINRRADFGNCRPDHKYLGCLPRLNGSSFAVIELQEGKTEHEAHPISEPLTWLGTIRAARRILEEQGDPARKNLDWIVDQED